MLPNEMTMIIIFQDAFRLSQIHINLWMRKLIFSQFN